MIQILAQFGTLLLSILEVWIRTHPDATLAIVAAEIVISLVASQLPMPKNGNLYYHALFIVFTALALNPERVRCAINVLRGVPNPPADHPANKAGM